MKNKALLLVTKLTVFLCLFMINTASAVNYTLTIIAQGSGTVTKNPTNSTYPSGVTVTITATPDSGWYFSNWSGDTNGSVNPLNLVMNRNLSITGNFLTYPVYSVTLTTNGQGSVILNPAGGSYQSNSIVTATASPATGWVFTGWSGGTNTSVNPLSLAVNANLSLAANFAQLPAFDVTPASMTNAVGSTVNFNSHAVGTAPLQYHWFFSGGSLNNATNSTLALTNVTPSQAGNYWVIATNNYGSATSTVVSLTLTNAGGSSNVVSSADEASLRVAIAKGGWITLAFSGTITLTNTINITNNVILDGTGVSVAISGSNAVRLFYVAPGASLAATNLTLADGLIMGHGSLILTNGEGPGMPGDAGAIYNDGGTVTLVACTVTNNNAEAFYVGGLARGGAIFNNGGTVALYQSTINNNSAIGGGTNGGTSLDATDFGLGGAIYNTNGMVKIIGCNVNSNLCQGLIVSTSLTNISIMDGIPWPPILQSATGNGLTMGGALYQASGTLTITSSSFSNNRASGGDGAPINMNFGSTYQVNGSPSYGGAVVAIGGNLVIDHSQFVANTAAGGNAGYHNAAGPAFGGAIYSASLLTISDISFFGNESLAGNGTIVPQGGSKGVDGFGGAIYNSGTATLDRCAVYSNSVQGGSAIGYAFMAANGGDASGGGIFNLSQLSATNCTIAQNSATGGSGEGGALAGQALGGGVFNNTNAMFQSLNLTFGSNVCSSPSGYGLTNGLIAGSQIANTNGTLRLHNSIIAGTNSNAYGSITDDGYNICSDGSAQLFGGSSFNFTDPKLGPLADYGGPTLCMALLPDSPAIDYADGLDFPATDQRGYIRPIGDGPDVGAYEYGSYLPGIPYLEIASMADDVMLSFTAFPQKMYLLQSSTNLSTWSDLNTNGPFATSTNLSQTVTMQGFDVRFFRLLVQ